jgi:hypothetical protein
MLAVRAIELSKLDREWRQEKEKAGTQGVGLVVGLPLRSSVPLAWIAASRSRLRRDHVQAC